jgi:hypothetical protein
MLPPSGCSALPGRSRGGPGVVQSTGSAVGRRSERQRAVRPAARGREPTGERARVKNARSIEAHAPGGGLATVQRRCPHAGGLLAGLTTQWDRRPKLVHQDRAPRSCRTASSTRPCSTRSPQIVAQVRVRRSRRSRSCRRTWWRRFREAGHRSRAAPGGVQGATSGGGAGVDRQQPGQIPLTMC